jgi:hypothetical protein
MLATLILVALAAAIILLGAATVACYYYIRLARILLVDATRELVA